MSERVNSPSGLGAEKRPDQKPASDRLESWQEIAAYLKRDLRTVQRWEKKEALPVHRHLHDERASVFAFKSELDTWWQNDYLRLAIDDKVETAAGPANGGIVHVHSALAPGSRFYIPREADAQFERALKGQESVILLTGPRQSGKTSLLARALERARSGGTLTIATDLSKLSATQFTSFSEFALALADELKESGTVSNPNTIWNDRRAPSTNLDRYLKVVLAEIKQRVIWAIDEADRLFKTDFANEFFALVRSWHNERALNPESAVHRLSVAITYAREAHLFISDENQSPFNVGTKVKLGDFTVGHAAKLNVKYGSPLTVAQIRQLYELTGGHPLLTHGSLQVISLGEFSFEGLVAASAQHEGPFGDHLRRLLRSLKQNAELEHALKTLLQGVNPSPEQIYELRACGALAGDSDCAPRLRCQIYQQFLERELQ